LAARSAQSVARQPVPVVFFPALKQVPQLVLSALSLAVLPSLNCL
jgi:hypothetical protein